MCGTKTANYNAHHWLLTSRRVDLCEMSARSHEIPPQNAEMFSWAGIAICIFQNGDAHLLNVFNIGSHYLISKCSYFQLHHIAPGCETNILGRIEIVLFGLMQLQMQSGELGQVWNTWITVLFEVEQDRTCTLIFEFESECAGTVGVTPKQDHNGNWLTRVFIFTTRYPGHDKLTSSESCPGPGIAKFWSRAYH